MAHQNNCSTFKHSHIKLMTDNVITTNAYKQQKIGSYKQQSIGCMGTRCALQRVLLRGQFGSVLVLAGVVLIFFTGAGVGLCFGFVLGSVDNAEMC